MTHSEVSKIFQFEYFEVVFHWRLFHFKKFKLWFSVFFHRKSKINIIRPLNFIMLIPAPLPQGLICSACLFIKHTCTHLYNCTLYKICYNWLYSHKHHGQDGSRMLLYYWLDCKNGKGILSLLELFDLRVLFVQYDSRISAWLLLIISVKTDLVILILSIGMGNAGVGTGIYYCSSPVLFSLTRITSSIKHQLSVKM